MRTPLTRALAVAAIAACGCTNDSGPRIMSSVTLPTLESVSEAEWQRLAQRRVLFGHQSVGRNIMDGIADILKERPEVNLWVVESRRLDTVTTPGFYHARVGRNRYPLEKAEEFVAVAESAFASHASVGMLKFCYADVLENTDPDSLFQAYQQRMAALAVRNPHLTRVHVTMPLTTIERGRAYWKKRILGRYTERDRNAVANRFNALLRAAYQGREPFFDLAALESTHPDGSRSYFMQGADTVYTLVEGYTNDGGHLNNTARRVVAEQLLIFLAKLPDAPAAGR